MRGFRLRVAPPWVSLANQCQIILELAAKISPSDPRRPYGGVATGISHHQRTQWAASSSRAWKNLRRTTKRTVPDRVACPTNPALREKAAQTSPSISSAAQLMRFDLVEHVGRPEWMSSSSPGPHNAHGCHLGRRAFPRPPSAMKRSSCRKPTPSRPAAPVKWPGAAGADEKIPSPSSTKFLRAAAARPLKKRHADVSREACNITSLKFFPRRKPRPSAPTVAPALRHPSAMPSFHAVGRRA